MTRFAEKRRKNCAKSKRDSDLRKKPDSSKYGWIQLMLAEMWS